MQGSGAGPTRVSSEAAAETDQSAAELEAYFAAQLKTAGWQRLAGGSDGPMAWSSWKLPRDGDWQGFLFVLQSPGARHRSLYVRAESPSQVPGGWMTSTAVSPSLPAPAAPSPGR
jgi:hypothetical protein